MKIVVVGGKLQGLEAVYLARQAGWDMVLVDKERVVPAQGICHEFYSIDVVSEVGKLKRVLRNADFIIPALENKAALQSLQAISFKEGVPLAYDSDAYEISSSKIASDKLFRENDIPVPAYWPAAKLPLIAKPSGESGSRGVTKLYKEEDLTSFWQSTERLDNWVVQEYIAGPSYSLEVVGLKGSVVSYQVTKLEMDAQFDCKRVLAPADLHPSLHENLKAIVSKIARLINLTGIMDIEVINDQGTLKVLEIDARLPSQTPITVWHSTGINLLESLRDVFVYGQLPARSGIETEKEVIFEHIRVTPQRLEVMGEHIMAVSEPLQLINDFWGADQALTNYNPGRSHWVATLIFTGNSWPEVHGKHRETIESICQHFHSLKYVDSMPWEE